MIGTYERLGLPIWATELEIIRATWHKLSAQGKSRAFKHWRRKIYKEMLRQHKAARKLYDFVQRGR